MDIPVSRQEMQQHSAEVYRRLGSLENSQTEISRELANLRADVARDSGETKAFREGVRSDISEIKASLTSQRAWFMGLLATGITAVLAMIFNAIVGK